MKWFALFLLSALPAFGQLTLQQMQPFFHGPFGPPPFTPRSIAGLTYWWVHTNTTVGSTIQLWPDLIWTNNAFNATSGNSPTNAAIGMRFQSGKYLQVTNWTGMTTNDGFFLICQFENNVSQRALYGGKDSLLRSVSMSQLNGSQHWISAGGGGGADISLSGTTISASQLFVYSGDATKKSYTNGVLVNTTGAPFNIAGPFAVTNMGYDPVFNGAGGVYIMELGWYSNATLTATDNYNISNYWKTFYP